jgi:hypothetical protein
MEMTDFQKTFFRTEGISLLIDSFGQEESKPGPTQVTTSDYLHVQPSPTYDNNGVGLFILDDNQRCKIFPPK